MNKGLMRYHFGTKKMEQGLLDLWSDIYWSSKIPYEDDLKKEAAYGSRIWEQEEEFDPYELLAAALIGRAAYDYVMCVWEGDAVLAKGIEGWFGKNGYSWAFFEVLQTKLERCKTDRDYQSLLDSIHLIH